ncbi:hypothetical protein [Drosophila suzukii associated hytrosavirus 1]|nr:hypothetical protein [Drosophila suzukii associated hytrosavirus 1]
MSSSSTATNRLIFTYYFVYKFIQQNVFIEILKSRNDTITTELVPRIIALISNLLNTIFFEIYFQSRQIKRVILSIYTSLLIILLHIFKDVGICEISFFLLNLSICEATIYHDFVRLWQIQLCLELSILVNYLTRDITLTVNGVFVPVYVLWIFSILLASTWTNNISVPSNHSRLQEDTNKERSLRARVKSITFTLIQSFLGLSHILIGCTTIRNNIFMIFDNDEFLPVDIMVLMTLICLITLCSFGILKLRRRIKLVIILVLVLLNYIGGFFIEHSTILKYNGFFISIFIKKILGICKCCISSFLLADSEKSVYTGLKFRCFKFFILNSDSISFIINTLISDNININFLNIFIVVIVIVLYNLFKHL